MPGSIRENGPNTARRSTPSASWVRGRLLDDEAETSHHMLNGKTVIAVIPARGGSKSVPGKNIRSLGGKPLLAWSIEVARQVSEIDRIIVSTEEACIASVGSAHCAKISASPPHRATDEALVIDALKDL